MSSKTRWSHLYPKGRKLKTISGEPLGTYFVAMNKSGVRHHPNFLSIEKAGIYLSDLPSISSFLF